MNITDRKGITLTEIIITVALIGIIMVPVSILFTTTYASFINEADKSTAQQAAREILYGKGVNSFGIMGDLERSSAASKDVYIDGISEDIDVNGQSLRIMCENGSSIQYTYEPGVNGKGRILYQADSNSEDYFSNDNSMYGRDIEINDFSVEKVKKQTSLGSDILKITVKVTCGKSGIVSLASTYRFPDIER